MEVWYKCTAWNKLIFRDDVSEKDIIEILKNNPNILPDELWEFDPEWANEPELESFIPPNKEHPVTVEVWKEEKRIYCNDLEELEDEDEDFGYCGLCESCGIEDCCSWLKCFSSVLKLPKCKYGNIYIEEASRTKILHDRLIELCVKKGLEKELLELEEEVEKELEVDRIK